LLIIRKNDHGVRSIGRVVAFTANTENEEVSDAVSTIPNFERAHRKNLINLEVLTWRPVEKTIAR